MEDYPMRTYDLTPFYRSTVGFDRFFNLLDQVTSDGSPGYPPYNIERTGENAYRISVAVSGFSQGELSIVAKENTLTIKGEKSANENGKDTSEVLYRGIAARAFERVFQLADFVQVKNASLENGLLHVDLVREIPEAKKPRSIPINSGAKAPQVVDASVAAYRAPAFGRFWLNAKTPRETGAFFARIPDPQFCKAWRGSRRRDRRNDTAAFIEVPNEPGQTDTEQIDENPTNTGSRCRHPCRIVRRADGAGRSTSEGQERRAGARRVGRRVELGAGHSKASGGGT